MFSIKLKFAIIFSLSFQNYYFKSSFRFVNIIVSIIPVDPVNNLNETRFIFTATLFFSFFCLQVQRHFSRLNFSIHRDSIHFNPGVTIDSRHRSESNFIDSQPRVREISTSTRQMLQQLWDDGLEPRFQRGTMDPTEGIIEPQPVRVAGEDRAYATERSV